MTSIPYLSTLAPEILQLVFEHTHASGHWPLAQTCKYIYLHSQEILDRHRKAHQELRIASDLDPSTVPNLLWSVFSHGVASIEAWHVRELEVWGEGDYRLPLEVNADTGEVTLMADTEPWSLPGGDIDYFCTKLLKLPNFYGEHRDLNDEVRESLESHANSWLKSLLLAYLPRIQALRYAQVDDECVHHSLVSLCDLIYWCESTGTWLPGLKTLEKVAVGVRLDRVDGAVEPPDTIKRRTDEFCALLCLPNLSEVYFSHLSGYFHIQEAQPYGLQLPLHKPSSVRTIILDLVEYTLSDELLDFLATAPRGLQNLAICCKRSNEDDYPERSEWLARKLSKHQAQSLQRLCFYSDDDETRLSSMNWLPADEVKAFEDLRVVYLSWKWTEHDLDPTRDPRSRPELPEPELQDRLLEVFRCDLPAKMEIIAIDGFKLDEDDDSVSQEGETDVQGLDYVDDAIEAMIKSGRYENLKAVLLEGIQDEMSYLAGTTVSFPKAMKAAEERGVYIHVEGSKPPPGFSTSGEFVLLPRRDCMVTGRFAVEDKERLRRSAHSPT